MRKKSILISLIFLSLSMVYSQTIEDFFDKKSNVKITWLGIDYSHVKLIGGFAQFNGAGEKTTETIRDDYFPAWNSFVYRESSKYDLKKMLHKPAVDIDLEMIRNINEASDCEKMNMLTPPEYTDQDIKAFIESYPEINKEGFVVLFIAEYMDKQEKKALYHYIVLNPRGKEILIHERIIATPGGFGVKNYWARSIFESFKIIGYRFNKYRKRYASQ
jgi:hypothetical protein